MWPDTPGSPLGALPVLDALEGALEQWRTGSYRWPDWALAAADSGQLFATFLGVPRATVALMSSFAEAAVTVAACRGVILRVLHEIVGVRLAPITAKPVTRCPLAAKWITALPAWPRRLWRRVHPGWNPSAAASTTSAADTAIRI